MITNLLSLLSTLITSAAGVLAVFGNTLPVFRVLGAVLFSLTFGLFYSIGHRIIENKPLAFTLTSLLGALCSLFWIYNYNHLILLCILVIFFLEYHIETRETSENLGLHVVVGLLYGLTPIIKQSTGAILLMLNTVCCGYKILTRRAACKAAFLRIGASALPVCVFAVCLPATGSFGAFYDYAVRGVQTFTHHESWLDYILAGPIDFCVGLIPLIVTAVSVYTIIRGKSRVSRSFHTGTLLLCWAGTMVAYPICDFVHACVAAAAFLVPLFCCVGQQLRISKKEGAVCCVVAALVLCCGAGWIVKDLPGYKRCELPCFEGVPILAENEAQIQIVNRYMQAAEEDGVEVIIADEDAAAFMIPAGKCYQNFNLLLAGNVGTNTTEELLWREQAIYLVVRDDIFLGKQSHTELITYIKENYTKIGEVLGFDAYTP